MFAHKRQDMRIQWQHIPCMFLVQVQNLGFAANNIGHCEIVIQAMCNAAINIFSFIKECPWLTGQRLNLRNKQTIEAADLE